MSKVLEPQLDDFEALRMYAKRLPNNALCWYYWGVYLQNQAEYVEALACLKKAHKLLPQFLPCLEKIAHIAYYSNLFKISATFYRKVEKIRPLNEDEKRQIAWASQNAKRYRQAIRYYEELSKIRPRDTYIWVNLGFCYGKIENSPKALECSQKAHDINPHDYVAMLNIGFRYWVLQDLPQARSFTEKALGGYKDYAFALMNMGHINWCEGNETKATDFYRRSKLSMNDNKNFTRLMREDSKYIVAYGITVELFEKKLAYVLQDSENLSS